MDGEVERYMDVLARVPGKVNYTSSTSECKHHFRATPHSFQMAAKVVLLIFEKVHKFVKNQKNVGFKARP